MEKIVYKDAGFANEKNDNNILNEKFDTVQYHKNISNKINEFALNIWVSFFEKKDYSKLQKHCKQINDFGSDLNKPPAKVFLVYKDVELGYIDTSDIDNMVWYTECRFKQIIYNAEKKGNKNFKKLKK